MGKQQKAFDFPADLREAQRALVAARAERSAFLASLPQWGGDMAAVSRGVDEEQRAEASRLEESERRAALAVTGHPFWAEVPVGDRVAARTQLQHVDGAVQEGTA
ncbi:hypothetical protein [Streptomyces sp. CBMA156]|uniref:hypothetical protein n=1 Tax=Streptomyces sp. CBMA156 TaxID=1930280 RepID=UPI001661F76C|nr:hypothetical protein [Streptomyces sp. CBMA156]MBD0675470.1 hypothetical protein [Streptomyces sp. CBMA156]